LVIIVTPHIVRPARPGDIIKAPTDDTVPPNDADFFLLGQTELTHKQAQRLTPLEARIAAAGGAPDTGHMLDLNTRKEATDATVQ
jgi:pilus assembly protein CpaC